MNDENQFYGHLPEPVTELTFEQDLKLRQIKDALERPETQKEDIITVFLALQKQTFVLSNSLMNLVAQWHQRAAEPDPTTTEEGPSRPGTLYGIKI